MSEEFQLTIEPAEGNAHVNINTDAQLQSNDDNIKAVDIATLLADSGHQTIETGIEIEIENREIVFTPTNLQCHSVASSNIPSWHRPTITPVIPIEQQLHSFIQDDKSNFLRLENDKVLAISNKLFEEEPQAPRNPLQPDILPTKDFDSGDTNIGGGVANSEPGPSTSRVRRGRGARTRGGRSGAVKAGEVAGGGDAALTANAVAGHRRRTRRPHAVDGLNIVRNEDLPHDVPLETRVTKRRKRNCGPPSSAVADAAPSSALSVPPMPEIPSSAAADVASSSADSISISPMPEIVRRGRGVRTRGGRSGAVKAGEVAGGGDAALTANAVAGHRRRTRRPHAVDGLKIVRNEDLPHDVPLETRVTKRRKRNCGPPSSAVADAAPSSALSVPPMPEIPSSAAADVASSSADSISISPMPEMPSSAVADAAPSSALSISPMPEIPSSAAADVASSSADSISISLMPEMFLECIISPPQREQEAPRDDDIDLLSNHGSEPESESDDEEIATPFVPRSLRFLMETPQDDDDDAALDVDFQAHASGHSTTLPAPSSKPASSGPAIGPNFYDFEWRAFPNPPIAPELRRETFSHSNAGPTTPCVDPYDIFIAIWDRQIMEHIASETNIYAQELAKRLMSKNALQPRSRIREWRDTTTDELYTYFAIILAMGSVIKHRQEAYWNSKPSICCTPYFKAHMSLRRFQLLSRCLHFNRNEDLRALNVESSEAKMFKVEPVVTHLNRKFQQMYNLQQNLALDESLLQWKGWLSFNQHIPNKAAAIGVKTYEVCESQTGYLWRFEVHTCKQSRQANPSDPLDAFTPTLVLRLLKGLENRGHTVWMDNFYNSPALARKLKTLGFDCVGTLRTNRKFVPEALHGLTKEDMRPDTIAGLTSGDVDVMVWRDKNRVATISTYHGNSVAERNGTIKPNLVFDYNIMMGGVDKKDQMLAMYPVERRRTKIWYKKFFRRLLNVSVLNAYIICKRSSSRINHSDFRETLISSLLEKHSTGQMVEQSRTADSTLESPTVKLHHLADQPFVGRERLRRVCKICKKRVKTYCVGCNKSVCMTPCFVQLHDG